MPYDTDDKADVESIQVKLNKAYGRDVPANIARQWMHVYEKVMEESGDKSKAYAAAWAVAAKSLGVKPKTKRTAEADSITAHVLSALPAPDQVITAVSRDSVRRLLAAILPDYKPQVIAYKKIKGPEGEECRILACLKVKTYGVLACITVKLAAVEGLDLTDSKTSDDSSRVVFTLYAFHKASNGKIGAQKLPKFGDSETVAVPEPVRGLLKRGSMARLKHALSALKHNRTVERLKTLSTRSVTPLSPEEVKAMVLGGFKAPVYLRRNSGTGLQTADISRKLKQKIAYYGVGSSSGKSGY